MAEARAIADSRVAAEAWRVIAELNANTQRWDDALSAIEIALQHDPRSRSLRLLRATLLAQLGADRAALTEFESLAREAADSPGLLAHLATQLAAAGRIDDAAATLEQALVHWPTDAMLHGRLARLRWQHGAGLDALRALEDAIASHPAALQLQLVAADLLRSAGEPERALDALHRGLASAPESATFRTSIGAVLEGMGRAGEALPYLHEALRRAPRSETARRNLVPALLRTGAARDALAICDELLGHHPDDQHLVAQRATALRVLRDPEYRWLCDYERLVRTSALRPPAHYADIADFNAAFGRELAALHHAVRHPLDQSLRGGSQTERNLPRDNPVFAEFFAMLDAPIREYIAALGDDGTHPVDRRRLDDYRLSGSWSVQLRAGGFHVNHVHPRGWLSSAYYVSLPDVSDADTRAGWLKFGEPPLPLDDCGPEWFVKPAAGMLALFPSYFWHGTVAFAAGGPRLTAAFDVLPA